MCADKHEMGAEMGTQLGIQIDIQKVISSEVHEAARRWGLSPGCAKVRAWVLFAKGYRPCDVYHQGLTSLSYRTLYRYHAQFEAFRCGPHSASQRDYPNVAVTTIRGRPLAPAKNLGVAGPVPEFRQAVAARTEASANRTAIEGSTSKLGRLVTELLREVDKRSRIRQALEAVDFMDSLRKSVEATNVWEEEYYGLVQNDG